MKKYKNQVEQNEEIRLARQQARRQAAPGRVAEPGVQVCEVEPGGVASELGIVPGDRLLAIDGLRARDILQLKKADLQEATTLSIVSASGVLTHFEIEKEVAESLGLGVDAELFDGVRRCVNKCPFCFVDQLPPRVKGAANLRRTLYVRDDDYRLSFLHGHYITLTNLKQADYERIIEEKLSPLCVSVHATNPALRAQMVGNASGGAISERLRFLIANGITINAQVVLCPGMNDGPELDRTIQDLMGLSPGIESLAIVPVGLTRFMPEERQLRPLTNQEARAVLHQLRPHQRRARAQLGTHFVYGSDELYLLAGEAVPSAGFYDGYPQYANGVGMVRSFLDELGGVRPRPRRPGPMPRVTAVTGSLAAPLVRAMAQVFEEKQLATLQVAEVQNSYWGGNVGCAGLLMGAEVLNHLKGLDGGDCVFIPPDAVDNHQRLLDDITLTALSSQLGVPVRCDASGPRDLAQIVATM